MRRIAGALAFLICGLGLTWSRPAEAAIEIWTSDDGLRTVEFSPSLKLFVFGATGFLKEPSGYSEFINLFPEEMGLSDEWIYPSVGGGALTRLRLRFLADIHERVRFVVHYEHRPRIISHGRILSSASTNLQGDEAVPYRITPLQWEITSSAPGEDSMSALGDDDFGNPESTFVYEHEIDRLFFLFSLPRVDITIGRQSLSWGVGRLWSPMDVFAPLTPTDLDRAEQRGIDALRLTFSFSSTSLMEVVVAAGMEPDEDGDLLPAWSQSSLAWMLRTLQFGLEWMVMAGKLGPDEVFGGAISGQIRGVVLRGSLTATTSPRTRTSNMGSLFTVSGSDTEETNLRSTVGIEFGTSFGLTGIIEYHYNGFGVLQTSQYVERGQQLVSQLSRGIVSGLAQHYAGLTLAWQPVSVLSLSFVYIQNLQDGSLVLQPIVEYSVSDEVRLGIAAYIPIGRDPEWDLDNAEAPLRLHSEFGAGSQLYVLQLRINI